MVATATVKPVLNTTTLDVGGMVRAAVITGPGQVELRQEPYPVPGDDQVLVDVAGLRCVHVRAAPVLGR